MMTEENLSDDSSSEWRMPWNESQHLSISADSQNVQQLSERAGSAGDDGLTSLMNLNDHKAGMQGLDKDRINKIIYETSKGSRFFINEQRKEHQIQSRIASQMEQLEKLTAEEKLQGLKKADQLLTRLEQARDLTRTIVHVDMDAFYAAVEMLDRPDLRDRPMAVGGSSMLCTSNYAARRFGVRAAMPGFIARKLCPELVIIRPNFEKYQRVSNCVRAVFAEYDPNFSSVSLDEAYLDLTDHLQHRLSTTDDERTFPGYSRPEMVCHCPPLTDNTANEIGGTCESVCSKCHRVIDKLTHETFGVSADEAVREMRFRIYQTAFLTASAGIGPNTMLAKICSDRNKPNGQFSVEPTKEAVLKFIHDLPIRKVCGIGKVSEKMLAALGINTCSQLYEKRGILYHLYSSISFESFMKVTLGLGSTHLERDSERKSISIERTFGDLADVKQMFKLCHDFAESLSESLKEENLVGKTVGIKLKLSTFEILTRAQTLPKFTSDVEQIYSAACDLLRVEIAACAPRPLCLRLMGVRVSTIQQDSSASKSQPNSILTMFKRKQALPDSETESTTTGGENSMHLPTCPVCMKLLTSLSARSINSHVEQCLMMQENDCTELSERKQGLVVDDDSRDGHDIELGKLECCTGTSNVQTAVEDSTLFSSTTCKSNDCSDVETAAAVPPALICPVCNVPQFSVGQDWNRLNSHIDQCLNRSLVRDIITDSNSQPLSSDKSRTKSRASAMQPSSKRRKVDVGPKQTSTLDCFVTQKPKR